MTRPEDMKNLVLISRECSLDIPKKTLVELYEDATKDKMGFLLMDMDAEKDKRFRKNFTEYYEIEEVT